MTVVIIWILLFKFGNIISTGRATEISINPSIKFFSEKRNNIIAPLANWFGPILEHHMLDANRLIIKPHIQAIDQLVHC